MRLLSLLPILFWVLVSQAQNCQITDLVTALTVTDPASCKYSVKLDFKHQGTTNQFIVEGNGTNYGTFTYGQLPVTIGPLMAMPNTPTVREFVVRDAVVADCKAQTVITLPPCSATGVCDIRELTAVPGTCTAGTTTFPLKINFVADNPGNNFFEVWAGSGAYLGIFPLSALPLTLPAFPSNGTALNAVKVCINDQPNCCETLSFNAPICNSNPCDLLDLTVEVGECTSDSTFKVSLNLLNSPVPLTGSFTVTANGALLGTYNASQLPLSISNFPWNGHAFNQVQVCLPGSVANLKCCLEEEFLAPPCLPYAPCEISSIKLETGTCSSDSTYQIKIHFKVADPAQVDSFVVWADGKSLGKFALSSLPLSISNYPWTPGSIYSTIRICTGNVPACCRERKFVVAKCLPFGDCKIKDIAVQVGPCNANGTYPATLSFQATNPGNGTYTVTGNGTALGTYPISLTPLTVTNFPSNGAAADVVKICINPLTPNTPPCCESKTFEGPACNNAACEIYDLKVSVSDCTSDSTYKATLNFAVQNPGGTMFSLIVNGKTMGNFNLSQLPLTLTNFPSNGTAIDYVKVCIVPNSPAQTPCCRSLEFQGPVCGSGVCEIYDLKAEAGVCTSDSTYKVTLRFSVHNPGNNFFEVWSGSGKYLGIFPLSALPLTIANFPSNGTISNSLKVCINDHPDCCRTVQFVAPKCGGGACEIYDLKVSTSDCTSDSTYKATLNFAVQNPGGTMFSLIVNGKTMGNFNLSQLPLTLTNFPSNGTAIDYVKVCIVPNSPAQTPCCRSLEFQGPVCGNKICEIYDLKVSTNDCTSDSTYKATLNFAVQNPGGTMFSLIVNGKTMGNFNLSALPLTLTNFPSNGAATDYVKVCIVPNNPAQTPCCRSLEFKGPVCGGGICEIYDLKVSVSDCTSDSTYKATLNFAVQNPGGTMFSLIVNGKTMGNFNLSQLPLTLTNFPSNGTAIDYVKVCIVPNSPAQTPCCRSLEFQGPVCGSGVCEIYDLKAEAGVCTSDSTYKVTLRFSVHNPGNNFFEVWSGSGKYLGIFPLSALPLTIANFPSNGTTSNSLKVCINDHPDCCRTVQFVAPKCGGGACEIYDLKVSTSDCTSDSTYKATLNFAVQNPGGNIFVLVVNGKQMGTYNLSQLPLTLTNFPSNGAAIDVVKVCIASAGALTCCRSLEFKGPACGSGPCEVYDLKVETGVCTSDSSYKLTLNFKVSNPATSMFSVSTNGHFVGFYNLSQLPLTLNVSWDGGANDLIEVCAVTQPGIACCKKLEFKVPDCIFHPSCEIYDLVVETGNCSSDSTYKAIVKFKVQNPTGNTFSLWGNGQLIGTYNLSQLPLSLPNFLWNGGLNDVIKVCMGNDPASISCCQTKEFPVPACLQQCEISNFQFNTGDCTSDTTYEVKLNFKVPGITQGVFGVWANGHNIGFYNLTQLPLIIPKFPSDGGVNDVIKVCLIGNNVGTVLCCYTQEFPTPDCVDTDCGIWDLQVVKTPCVCGQFFAVVTFEYKNGSTGGFDIVGNGKNYGNFAYNTKQPIILGPLPCNGTIEYEFVVKDHFHPDCNDVFLLGKVSGQTPTEELPGGGSGSLSLSPNPADEQLSVTAQLDGISAIGQAQVEIRHADGRLVQTQVIGNASSFQLDVSTLPAGVYRLTVLADKGRLEGSFVKQ